MPVHLPETHLSGSQLAEVAKALEVLERYFADFDIRFDRNGPKQPKTADNSPLKGSIRDRVFSVIKNDFVTIDEICDATKLDKKKIRGVVNAPDVECETQDLPDGRKKYKFVKFVKRER